MPKTTKNMKDVENALEVLVLAYEKERHKEPTTPLIAPTPFDPRFKFTSAKDLEYDLRTKDEIYLEDIIEIPIQGALRLAIRELGKHIWLETKSIDAMQEALERVASRHPHMEGRILSAVDHAWDGIGGMWHS